MRCVLLCVLLLAAPARAATLTGAQTGFSADRTLTIDGRTYRGRLWAMPGIERHEQAIHGLRPVILLRDGSPFGEIVLTGMKTLVQFEIPQELRHLSLHELKRRPIGRESVNGIATTKYAIEDRLPQGRANGTLWLSDDGIPMRLSGTFTRANGKATQIRWELSRVKIEPQPAQLFAPPAGLATLPPEAIAPLIGLKLKGSGPQ